MRMHAGARSDLPGCHIPRPECASAPAAQPLTVACAFLHLSSGVLQQLEHSGQHCRMVPCDVWLQVLTELAQGKGSSSSRLWLWV